MIKFSMVSSSGNLDFRLSPDEGKAEVEGQFSGRSGISLLEFEYEVANLLKINLLWLILGVLFAQRCLQRVCAPFAESRVQTIEIGLDVV